MNPIITLPEENVTTAAEYFAPAVWEYATVRERYYLALAGHFNSRNVTVPRRIAELSMLALSRFAEYHEGYDTLWQTCSFKMRKALERSDVYL